MRIVRRSALYALMVTLSGTAAFAYEQKLKPRSWESGTLIAVESRTGEVRSRTSKAQVTTSAVEYLTFVIAGNEYVYTVDRFERPSGGFFTHFVNGLAGGTSDDLPVDYPKLTRLKEPVQYAIDKELFYVIDERGKEFRGRVRTQERIAPPAATNNSATQAGSPNLGTLAANLYKWSRADAIVAFGDPSASRPAVDATTKAITGEILTFPDKTRAALGTS